MSPLSAEATDEMLMVRYQRGDREAFAHLVRRHASAVFSYASWALGDPSSAQRVTEQVFFTVVGRTAEFKHEVRFTAWLYAMAHALCVQHRQPGATPSATIDGLGAPPSDEEPPVDGARSNDGLGAPPSDEEPPVDGARSNAGRAATALADLPIDQRDAFLLREVARLPFADIAAITQSDQDEVRARVRHALERMHAAVSESEEYARALR